MPYFAFVAAILTGATATPLSTWQYRYPPSRGVLEAAVGTSAVGVVHNLTTGPESIVQAEVPVGIGFAAGTLPARLNAEIIMDPVEPGQEIVWTFRNTTGGTLTVNGWVTLTYGKL
jgi:hypothetical protein